MFQAVRRIQFCAGHRVYGHESKCKNFHGHNYVAFFHAEAEELDDVGRVIDFGFLKVRLAGWIDEHWDHGMLLWRADEEGVAAARSVCGQKVFLLDSNPTAENMGHKLLHSVAPEMLAGTGVTVTKVVLWETENCYAEVSLNARH